MRIYVETIDHTDQQYPTVGNWTFNKDFSEGDLVVQVSNMDNWRYEALVAVHEILEALLCDARGISEADVTNFDIEFENGRKPGNIDEPGDNKKAPYKKEHRFASKIERLFAKELGVHWKTYEKIVNNL